jgi:hypothetical protein
MPMNSIIEIRTAPSGKVYVVRSDQPICDAAGGLLYFDNRKEALEFIESCDTEELLDAVAYGIERVDLTFVSHR